MKLNQKVFLKEIVEKLSKKIEFDVIPFNTEIFVEEVNPVESYNEKSIIFINSKKLLDQLDKEPAILVTTQEILNEITKKNQFKNPSKIITKNVDIFRAFFLQTFAEKNIRDTTIWGRIHPSSVIHPTAVIPESAIIAPHCTISKNVRLGENVVILAHCVIEEDVSIDDNTIIYPYVYVGWGCKIGKNCIIYPGTIIGADGFGFAQDENFHHYRIPQLGIVEIEDNVVIGANCCIDRAAYDRTLIRKGVITDNFVHIAHNCEIGENSILVAQVGIAGSSRLGKNVICSGQVGISDHVNIPDNTILLARTAVLDSIQESGAYMGYPAISAIKFQKLQIHLSKLDKYVKEIKELKEKINDLEKNDA